MYYQRSGTLEVSFALSGLSTIVPGSPIAASGGLAVSYALSGLRHVNRPGSGGLGVSYALSGTSNLLAVGSGSLNVSFALSGIRSKGTDPALLIFDIPGISTDFIADYFSVQAQSIKALTGDSIYRISNGSDYTDTVSVSYADVTLTSSGAATDSFAYVACELSARTGDLKFYVSCIQSGGHGNLTFRIGGS